MSYKKKVGTSPTPPHRSLVFPNPLLLERRRNRQALERNFIKGRGL